MSIITKTKKVELANWKSYILPVYVVLTALLIIFLVYNFIVNSVYWTGYNNGAQEWYQTAITQLLQEVSQKCDPVAVNMWETTVNVINVECLSQQAQQPVTNTVESVVPNTNQE